MQSRAAKTATCIRKKKIYNQPDKYLLNPDQSCLKLANSLKNFNNAANELLCPEAFLWSQRLFDQLFFHHEY